MKEGYYWFRGVIAFGQESYSFPKFAIVRIVGDDIRLMGDDTALALTDARGEWRGPLVPPSANGTKALAYSQVIASSRAKCAFVCQPGEFAVGDRVSVYLPDLNETRAYTVVWMNKQCTSGMAEDHEGKPHDSSR